MVTQEIIWVHGNSGQIQVLDEDWGEVTPYGGGLFLKGKVRDKFDPKTSRDPWVQFHIPTPRGIEDKLRLRLVKLRFSTDCNPADPNPPYDPSNFVKLPTDFGGAMIQQLHVYDGETLVQAWDPPSLGWQSQDLNHFTDQWVVLDPAIQIFRGVGVSIRLWFKNQFFVQKLICVPGHPPDEFASYQVDPNWDGKPWPNDALATDTKRAKLSSIGCEFFRGQ